MHTPTPTHTHAQGSVVTQQFLDMNRDFVVDLGFGSVPQHWISFERILRRVYPLGNVDRLCNVVSRAACVCLRHSMHTADNHTCSFVLVCAACSLHSCTVARRRSPSQCFLTSWVLTPTAISRRPKEVRFLEQVLLVGEDKAEYQPPHQRRNVARH